MGSVRGGLLITDARPYDPNTGSFIQHDPSGFPAGYTNLYTMVGNKVTTFVDPDGRQEQSVAGAGARGAANGALVGAANVGQKLWAPFRWIGLTRLVGLEDRLQRQDAWLVCEKNKISEPGTTSRRISDGAANVAAGAGYAATAGPLALQAGQKACQMGSGLAATAAGEGAVVGTLTATQIQNLIVSSGDRVVTVFTRITQSPAANRMLYSWPSQAMCEKVRQGTDYVGRIPADLFARMQADRLIYIERTMMGDKYDDAYVFTAEAMGLLQQYFQAAPK